MRFFTYYYLNTDIILEKYYLPSGRLIMNTLEQNLPLDGSFLTDKIEQPTHETLQDMSEAEKATFAVLTDELAQRPEQAPEGMSLAKFPASGDTFVRGYAQ
jgi:predicted DNA-binding ribbon-helix-helix protein